MAIDAWVPVGLRLAGDVAAQGAIYEGSDWQIYRTSRDGRALVVRERLLQRWVSGGLIDRVALTTVRYGDTPIWVLTSGPEYALVPVDMARSPNNKAEALAFAAAFRATRATDPNAGLHDAIYVERYSRLLPVWSLSAVMPAEVVLGRWLTGGVETSPASFRRLASLTAWMPPEYLREVIEAAGVSVAADKPKSDAHPSDGSEARQAAEAVFRLAGRPKLESFLNDYVIDIVRHPDRYKPFGLEFPQPIALYGPPGCGKSYAVDQLAEFLGWPTFSIDSSTVGSPYIHDTPKKVAEVFERAAKAAPSVVVIDEMDAFLTDRDAGSGVGTHHVEEVAEFLRRIPEATQNHVLVIAMTNRLDLIDPAILRRGRFDHVVEVGMPSREELEGLLDGLLSSLPRESEPAASTLAARLEGRPLSDVAFVVREAGRWAAKYGKDKLDGESFDAAMRSLPSSSAGGASKKIGF